MVKRPRDYRAWLVDLDGTLYHALWVRLAMAGELLLCGRHAIRTIRAFRRCHEQLRSTPSAQAADPLSAQVAATATCLQLAPADVQAVVEEWMVRRPGKWLHLFRRRGLLGVLADYRACGGKTALVSDYPARSKLNALRAESLFDVIVANGEAGGPQRVKPDPQGYRAAALRLGLPAQECLVVGDRAAVDGEAARRAGMDFCLVNNFQYPLYPILGESLRRVESK